jgi:predicted phage terminase large subunit-like protein
MPELLDRPRRRLVCRRAVSRKQRAFLESEATRTAYVGGRGSGKTFAGVLKSLAVSGRQPCSGTIIAPTYTMLHDSIAPVFEHLGRTAIAQARRAHKEYTLINGGLVRLRSADDPEKLRGPSNTWIWLDEAALMDRYVWRILLATLREDGGSGYAWVTTTPRGKKNWVYDLFNNAPPSYALVHSTTRENPFLSGELLADLEREYGVGWYGKQELLGEFVEPEGALFQRHWLRTAERVPSEFERIVRGWDLALTTKTASDYTVGVKIGITADQDIYVLDVVRGKWEWPDGRNIIVNTALLDGTACTVAVENTFFQLAAIQELYREPRLGAFDIASIDAERDKLSHALPVASRAKAGRLYIVPGTWNQDFIDELCTFTGDGKDHDDQVDGLSIALREVTGPIPRIETW